MRKDEVRNKEYFVLYVENESHNNEYWVTGIHNNRSLNHDCRTVSASQTGVKTEFNAK